MVASSRENDRTTMSTLLWTALGAFAATLALTPWAGWLSRRLGAVDRPDHRRVNREPVPRLGGAAILIGLAAASLIAGFASAEPLPESFHPSVFALSFAIVIVTGFWDDIRSLNATCKFSGQILAAAAAHAAGVRIDSIDVPFVGQVDCGSMGPALTVLWIVGVTNAINLIDGLDGLSAGLCAIAGTGLILLSGMRGTHFEAMAAATVGSCLGFLVFNFHPAKIFMGDAGSLGLGFLLACLSVTGSQKQSTATMLALPLVLLAIPIVDSVVCFLRRVADGRSPFSGDLGHVHHILLSLGWSQKKVVLSLYAVSAIFTAAAVGAGELRHEVGFVVLPAAVLFAAFLFYRQHGVLTPRAIVNGRRMRRVVDKMVKRFRDRDGNCDLLGRAARLMGLTRLVLRRLPGPGESSPVVVYRFGSPDHHERNLSWRIDDHFEAEIGAPVKLRSSRLFGHRLMLAPLMKAAADRAGTPAPPPAPSPEMPMPGNVLLADTSTG